MRPEASVEALVENIRREELNAVDRAQALARLRTTLDPETPSLIASIVRLLQALDLDIVAEGVETSAQLEHVRALGVDWVQGFLLSPPADAETIMSRLRGDLWHPEPVRV